jgi:adenosylcobyric acid synthase
VRRADLVVLPGTKATADDLAWLRETGLAEAVQARAAAGDPVLGICGGHQVLGRSITDDVEGRVGTVEGLGLLPHTTTFHPDKLVRRVAGPVPALDGAHAEGYEIRHGRTDHDDGDPVLVRGRVWGTSWHGLLDRPEPRVALLRRVAEARRLSFTPVGVDHARRREADLDRLADAVEAHLDVDALLAIATTPQVPARAR